MKMSPFWESRRAPLLEFLTANPNQAYTTSQLAEKTKVAKKFVRRALAGTAVVIARYEDRFLYVLDGPRLTA